MVLGREVANALLQLWSESCAEQVSGDSPACREFSVLPQSCWELRCVAVVPNQLQHTGAVLAYFKGKDTT